MVYSGDELRPLIAQDEEGDDKELGGVDKDGDEEEGLEPETEKDISSDLDDTEDE